MTDLGRHTSSSSPGRIGLSKDGDLSCKFSDSFLTHRDGQSDNDLLEISRHSTASSSLNSPDEYARSKNLCTCQYPPERFDSIIKPSLDDVWSAENESDSSEAEKLKLIWEYAEKNKYLEPEKNDGKSDRNISLWALRKSFEHTSISCSDHDSIESGLTSRRQVNKIDQDDFTAQNKVSNSTVKKVNEEKPVLKNNKTSPSSKRNSGKLSRGRLGDIKQSCKWFSRTCGDSGHPTKRIEDEIISGFTANYPLDKDSFTEVSETRKTDRKQNRNSAALSDTSSEHLPLAFESSSCSITPDSLSSDSTQKQQNNCLPKDDTTSNESLENGSRSVKSDSLQSLTRIFRRSRFKNRTPSTTFCGYSMERDYCVDVKTDQIFKEFLMPDPKYTTPCIRRPPPRTNKSTQLRRQLMRKQYSDSVAVYYGQRMRRWRVQKQRSDSVNCPVDRGVLRRQEHIEEEYYPIEDATPSDNSDPNAL